MCAEWTAVDHLVALLLFAAGEAYARRQLWLRHQNSVSSKDADPAYSNHAAELPARSTVTTRVS